jgi:RNA polymerase sigma-70 factor (ECF subfamily)
VARVHGLVLRVVQRRAWAEEAVEDTYWQVWRQAARFDAARGRPLTWLLAIARTRAIDLLRREQRFQHESLDAEGDDGQPAHEGARTPMHDAGTAAAPDLLEATRDGTRLHAALATLDARSRQLLALAFFRGLTHEEIATQEQMPLGSVKSVIRRALQQLRQKLDTDAGDLP